MKYTILYLLLLAACLPMSCAKEEMPLPETDTTVEEPAYTEDELLVKFSPEVTTMLEQAGVGRGVALSRSGSLALDDVLTLVGSYELERVFPINAKSEALTRKEGLHQWYVVRFGEQFTAKEVADRLSVLGEVQKVNFNHTIKRAYTGKAMPLTREALSRIAASRTTQGDPLFAEQWNMVNRGDLFTSGEVVKSLKDADVQVEQAWDLSRGDESIIVAVLDEGVWADHPDLKASMWHNTDEIPGSKEDNDGNGYAGDYYGYNFIQDTGLITTNNINDSGHGSHVAGVIAAVNNNGEGISSIAGGDGKIPGVKIMSCQLFSGLMSGTSLQVVRAVKYAADNGAVVLQCSWGFTSGAANIYDWGAAGPATQEQFEAYAPLEKAALDYFVRYAGSPNGPIEGGLAIFAAGNESAPMAGYPGADPKYISVAGTAADFTAAVYTNYGPGTTISAPGGDQDYYYDYVDETHRYGELGCILSTVPYHVSETGYAYMEGTSMATPHVSGVAALGLSYAVQLRRHFKSAEFRQLLLDTATPIDAYQTGYKTYCRYVADIGPVRPMQMNLSDCRGGMGSGQVNATALLKAIEGAGVELTFPNISVAPGSVVVVEPARYFERGKELTYTVSFEDEQIVGCSQLQGKLYFKGYTEGSTKAQITASDGQTQHFVVTVRKATNENGWL
ncbi:MAG: S8 family serine peptidase [Alistipes sp.]|nr:S8 family serine peptidase [Alistipes sp.]